MSQGGITLGEGLKPVTASSSASPSASTTAGAGTVRITLYVDYLCPTCGEFEQANGDYIESLVDSGAATVDIHPLAVLSNRSQGTKYSLRAANAAACVAEHSPDQFYAVNKALYAEQPEEGTPGLTDAQLTKVVTGVSGLQDRRAVTSCIADQDYSKWVDEQTTAVSGGDIPGSTLSEFPARRWCSSTGSSTSSRRRSRTTTSAPSWSPRPVPPRRRPPRPPRRARRRPARGARHRRPRRRRADRYSDEPGTLNVSQLVAPCW
jgi:hypothetical protein